ncbi:MAG TPA: GAF domain-containing protein, partial [Nitrospiria bacterium]
CVYIIYKEVSLQKIQSQLLEEQFKVLEEEATNSSLRARLRELSALEKAMTAIGMETEPDKALDTILKAALDLFNADRGSIMLLHEASQTLIVAASIGIPKETLAHIHPKVGEGIAGKIIQTGEPLLLSHQVNPRDFKNFTPKEVELRSCICAPLRSRSRIIGVINYSIIDPQKRAFTEYDLKLLTIFAQYSTLVIEAAEAARMG